MMKWFALLVLAVVRPAALSFATASLAAKVELTLQLNAAIELNRWETMEQPMVDAMNLKLNKQGVVEGVTVQSQTVLLNCSTLQVVLILDYTQSTFHRNIFVRGFLDQLEKAFQVGELNDLITSHLGTILSAKAFDDSDSSSTTESELPMSLPIATSSAIVVPYSSALSQGFYVRTYQGNLTVALPGLSIEIPKEDLDIVEWITQSFIQEHTPRVQNLMLHVRKVYVSNQILAHSSHRHRRLNSSPVMHLSFIVVGEGWSSHQETLNDLVFDDLIRRGFVPANEPDYFTSLQASSDTFRELDIPNDDGTVAAGDVANSNAGNGSDTLVIIAIAVTVVGAAFVGGICLVVMFRYQPKHSTESNSTQDHDIETDWWENKEEESLPNTDVLQLDSPSRHKFPVQKMRQDSEASLRSPSMLGDSDVDNWSVASEPLGADKSLFTIEMLDEFEASLPKRIRLRGKVEISLLDDDV